MIRWIGFVVLLSFCGGAYSQQYQGGDPSVYEQVLAEYDRGKSLYEAGEFESAFRIFSRLAVDGFPPAMLSVSHMLEAGQGVARNNNRSRFWLKKAADKQFPIAFIKLGLIYLEGNHVRRNRALAGALFRVANDLAPNEVTAKLIKIAKEGLSHDQLLLSDRIYTRIISSPGSASVIITNASRVGEPLG